MKRLFFAATLLASMTVRAAAGDQCDAANIPADIYGPYPARMAVNTVSMGGVSISSGIGLVKGARVEVTLPPDRGTFGDVDSGGHFRASVSPKRAVAMTGGSGFDCGAPLPALLVDGRPGTFAVHIRVVTPMRELNVDRLVEVFVPDTAVLLTNPYQKRLVKRGARLDPPISAQVGWIENSTAPRQGYPVTFTAPASGATVVFDNGANIITVTTDELGVARANATSTDEPGTFHIQATAGTQTRDMGEYRIGVTSTMTFTAPGRLRYGEPVSARMQVTFPGCDSMLQSQLAGGEIRADGFPLDTNGWWPQCYPNQTQDLLAYASLRNLTFGTHRIEAIYSGNNAADAAATQSATVVVEAPYAVATATGRGTMKIGYQDPQTMADTGTCESAAFTPGIAGAAGFPAAGPDADVGYGLVRGQFAGCTWSNGWELPPGVMVQRVLLELDEEPPARTVAWSYGAPYPDAGGGWTPLSTSVKGRQVTFDLPLRNPGDWQGSARDAVFALATPREAAPPGPYQDLWWGGSRENGWGLYIAQHRDVLFTTLFAYDAQGLPRWLVMPGGQWNAARTAYTGDLYRPRGSPLNAWNASSFAVGGSVGTATLAFDDADNATLSYVVDGIPGSKRITRQLFGPPSPLLIPGRVDDMWWGGPAQNGWGIAVAQQDETVFAVLYTYDAEGNPTWLVAPAGKRSFDSAHFISPLYRTRGAAWLGTTYDASRFEAMQVGTISLNLPRTGMLPGRYGISWLPYGSVFGDLLRQPF